MPQNLRVSGHLPQQGAGTPFTVTGVFEKGTDEERLADGLYARLFVNLAGFTASPDIGDEATVAGGDVHGVPGARRYDRWRLALAAREDVRLSYLVLTCGIISPC